MLCLIQNYKNLYSSNEIGKLLKVSFRLQFLCPFEMLVEIPLNTKRTNNVAESFHVHFNAQFYTAHPTILVFFSIKQLCLYHPQPKTFRFHLTLRILSKEVFSRRGSTVVTMKRNISCYAYRSQNLDEACILNGCSN